MVPPEGLQITTKAFKHYNQNLSLYLLHCTEPCNEFAKPIFASLRPDSTAPFEEMFLPNIRISKYAKKNTHKRIKFLLLLVFNRTCVFHHAYFLR